MLLYYQSHHVDELTHRVHAFSVVRDTIHGDALLHVRLVLDTNAGSVNETTGTITLNSFNPTALPTGQTTIDVTVKPASTDVSPARNVLLDINTSTATISGEIDTMATGGTTAGIDYTTTSSGY